MKRETIAIVALAGATLLIVPRAGDEPAPETVAPSDLSSSRVTRAQERGARHPVPAPPASLAAPVPESDGLFARYDSASQLLADYWGAAWPAVQEELREDGVDLDAIDLDELLEWDEAKTRLMQEMVEHLDSQSAAVQGKFLTWGEDLAVLEPSRFPLRGPERALSPDELSILTDLLAPLQEDLTRLAVQYHSAGVATAAAALESEELERFPIYRPGDLLASSGIQVRDTVLIHSLAGYGWVADLVVWNSDAPEFQSWLDEAATLQSYRLQVANDYLTTLQ